jgi:hypothetical protein
MNAGLTLTEAGNRLGVADADLNRLLRVGALPEARLVQRPEGRVWVIPEEHLPAVATRNGWTIDLRPGADNEAAIEALVEELAGSESPGSESSGSNDSSGSNEASGDLVAMATSIEAKETGAIETTATVVGDDADTAVEPTTALAHSIDLTLVDRLLAAHEDRVSAQVREQEARHALSTLNSTHDKTTGELEIERRERMATAERYREERRARAVADAKVAELRDRVLREMALADAEKEARNEALNRIMHAERDAANAVALLGWRGRRKFRRMQRNAASSNG